MDTCPTCSKKFKNVALHIRKVHDDIAIKYIDSDDMIRWREDGRPSCFDLKKDKYEVYKNDELIAILDCNVADYDYSNSVKTKDGKTLILKENKGEFKLYYGVKKAGYIGSGYDGECCGELFCKKIRKINF